MMNIHQIEWNIQNLKCLVLFRLKILHQAIHFLYMANNININGYNTSNKPFFFNNALKPLTFHDTILK